jgi:hypothetical protein
MKTSHIVILFVIFLVTEISLTSCNSERVIPGDQVCQGLAIPDEKIQLLPGIDDNGIITASTQVYLVNSSEPANSIQLQIKLLDNKETLIEQSVQAIAKPSGVDIAILPDMDPSLIASTPDPSIPDSTKKYYFADITEILTEQLLTDERGQTANYALIATLDRNRQRFASANEAYNFLLKMFPRIAVLKAADVDTMVGDQLGLLVTQTGERPRLVLVIRLQSEPARNEDYEDYEDKPLNASPILVLDIGQSGEISRTPAVTIVPLGLPPRAFDAPVWPPRSDWSQQKEEMRGVLNAEVSRAMEGISRVFIIPELSWKILLTQEQFHNVVFQVVADSSVMGPGEANQPRCQRKLDQSAPGAIKRGNAFYKWNSVAMIGTGLLAFLFLILDVFWDLGKE